MNAWNELKEKEYDDIWNKFESKFDFSPSIHENDWPGIIEPNPSLTFKISHIYGHEDQHYNELNKHLMDVFLQTFKSLIPENEWIFALDWHHPCYKFYPYIPFTLTEFDEWPVPILPNGDYYIFLEKNFDFGVFGHPWEQTMCIFGKNLLLKIEENKPNLFTELIRINGKSA